MPAQETSPAPSATDEAAALVASVQELHRFASLLLADAPDDPLWVDRLRALAQRLDALRLQSPDGLFYLLIHGAARTLDRYSSHHALVCTAVVAECAMHLGWPEPEQRSLALAGLSMNLSITALQDELVYRERTPTLDQRMAIDRHSARSVEVLSALGVGDALWLDVVGQHHAPPAPPAPPAEDSDEPPPPPGSLDPAARLARLLQRIDVFTSRMSPRKARKGLPAMQAMREACLGQQGTADDIGVALTRALGIYPPGSFVQLANGETAVVLKRGARASQPLVASVLGADRQPLATPVLHRTADPAEQVKGPARHDESRLRLDHVQLLTLAASP